MLQHTFCHLPGVGGATERRLWQAGLTTWEAVLTPSGKLPAAARRLKTEDLQASVAAHAAPNPAWFAERLTPAESWRLFRDFRHCCAYLDIETTGMELSAQVTTVALYDGHTVRTYVNGRNLRDFVEDIRPYRLLITYNGKSFDLPILTSSLGCRFDQAHIDLRYALASLGIRGGLKGCERQIGLRRPGMEDLDGQAAVILWRDYLRNKDARALETLLAYNVQDTVNLESLMIHVHNLKIANTPFAEDGELPVGHPMANPFVPDPSTVSRILREIQRFSYVYRR